MLHKVAPNAPRSTAVDLCALARRLALSFLGVVLSLCAFSQANAQGSNAAKRSGHGTSGFPVQESGYWTCYAGRGDCVYWIDDERIIFNGSHPADVEKTADGRREWKHKIYIWNLRSNVVTAHADADRGSLCFADGYIHYRRTEGSETITIAGPLGKEVEIERWKKGQYPQADPDRHGWNTRLSCYRYWPKPATVLTGQKIALKSGDGFLFFGGMKDNATEPVRYFPHASDVEVKLPVQRWKVTPVTVLRSEFDDAYIFFGPHRSNPGAAISTCPPKEVERFIYRLTRDGRLTQIRIPADPPVHCHVYRYAVVRTGIVLQTGAGHATNLDLSVTYLLRNETVTEVVRGVVNERAVSPNGCRFAIGISSETDKRKPVAAFARGHLKVINFCGNG